MEEFYDNSSTTCTFGDYSSLINNTNFLSPLPQGEEVRTLYITGLPADIKRREIRVLFRNVPGYEGAIIAGPPAHKPHGHPIAFATFTTVEAARSAMNSFNGFQLDQESTLRLKIEFAKANTKCNVRPRNELFPMGIRELDEAPYFSLSPKASPYSMAGSPPDQLAPVLRVAPVYPVQEHFSPPMISPAPQPVFCVYVTNIKPGLSQMELESAFSSFPGIVILRQSINASWLCIQSTSSQVLAFLSDCISRKCIVNNIEIGLSPGLNVFDVSST